MDSSAPVNVDSPPSGCEGATNSPYEGDAPTENTDPKFRLRGGSRGGRNGGVRGGGRGGRRREAWTPSFYGGFPHFGGYHYGGMPPPFPPPPPHFRGGPHPPPPPHHHHHHHHHPPPAPPGSPFMMHSPPPPPPPTPAHFEPTTGGDHINRRADHSDPQSRPVLTYFDLPGLAEPIRLCFILGGIPFEDRRISPEEWHNKYKSYSNTGQCPILEVDGRQIPQSQAILHYAASRAGLLPSSDEDQLTASMIVGRLNDTLNRLISLLSRETTPEGRRSKTREFSHVEFPPFLESAEKMLVESRQAAADIGQFFLGGDEPSYVDLILANVFNENDAGRYLFDTSPFPSLRTIQTAVNNHPAIRAYHRSKESKKLKLVYGPFFGLAHSIRWAFTLGNVEFEDVHMSEEEFAELKKTDKLLKRPFLEIDAGKRYTESTGILWYAAKLARLVPRNDINVAHAWSYCRTAEAAFTSFLHSERTEQDSKKCQDLLVSLDKMIAATQDQEGHCVASTLTFADVYVASIYYQMHHPVTIQKYYKTFPSDAELPHLERVTRMILSIPAIKKFEFGFRQTKPELRYFDSIGRAECIRRCFNYGGVEFVDTRIPFDEWLSEEKAKSPIGNVPVLKIEDEVLCETSALLSYAAERAGLVPMTYLGRAMAESIRSKYQDLFHVQRGVYRLGGEAKTDYQTEVKSGAGDEILKVVDSLASSCQHAKGYLVEGKLTWIDVYIHSELEVHGKGLGLLPDDWKNRYSALALCYDLVEKSYLERLTTKAKSKTE